MLKSMIRKEVRELLPIVAIALLAQFVVVSSEAGVNWPPLMLLSQIWSIDGTIPFVSSGSFIFPFLIGALAAIAIGLWQTIVDCRRGTMLFLLHRPVRREAILGAKMLVGTMLTLLILWLPIIGYGIWAAMPGTHASPFYWSMTGWAWNLSLLWPLIYLAAFLCGLRSARWYATRYWPLVAAPICMPILNILFWPGSWFSVLAPLGILAMASCFVLASFNVGWTRDYS